MRFGVLGPLEVLGPDGPVALGGPHQRAVLAALLAHRGRVVAADVLVDALWGDAPPRTADHTLRTHVSRLRRVLGGALATRDGGYLLDVPPDALDAARFDDLLAAAATAAGGGAVEALSRALALWRGPAYAGQADLPPVRGEARRLEEARTSAREALVAALLAAGAPAEAVAAAEALVADEPYREGAWALLVRALTAAGRPAEGLDAYHRAAAALDELGLEPSPVLREAQAVALRAGDPAAVPPAGQAAVAPAARPAPVGPPHPPAAVRAVPVPASSLVGREADVAAVDALLDRAPLVTLLGPGGVGKTRLALAVARRREARHAAGCRVVELAPLRDPAAVPAAVAAALDVAVDAGPPEAALARAGELDALVLLDNCEHVIDAVAAAVEAMVGGGTRLRLLATTRERLGVPGEHVHPVEPLAAGGPDSPAHRLFAERAAAAGAPDPPSPADPDVARVVRRLDGLPLAIEMAAARTATLGLGELADRLEERLDTLQDPRRRGDPRHRTLGAVIAWSEALLGDAEREALTGWTVFAGAVPLDDATAVLGTREDVVEQLAGRSLLALDTGRPRLRYRMLHTVRSAVRGRERPESAELRRRHAEHFAEVAAAADAAQRGPAEGAATERLESVTAELRDAHAWARAHDPALAVRLSRALHLFAVNGLHDEVLGWIARLAPAVDGDDAGTAVVDAAVAARLVLAGELATGAERARRAVALAGDDVTRIRGLETLADIAGYEGRLADGAGHARRLAEAAERSGDPVYRAVGTVSVALATGYAGEPDVALVGLEASAAELHAVPGGLSPTAEGWLHYCRGELILDRDPPAAIAALSRAVELADSVGNRYVGGVARVSLTSLEARAGEPAPALRSFDAVIRHWLLRGDNTHLLTTLRNLVGLLARVGSDVAAAELWAAVDSPRLAPTYGDEGRRLDAARETLVARLGPGGFAAAAAVGAARDVPAAATAALAAIAGALASG
jgi:predicted ATPase/DNA-binding SARP family transcriptional activator